MTAATPLRSFRPRASKPKVARPKAPSAAPALALPAGAEAIHAALIATLQAPTYAPPRLSTSALEIMATANDPDIGPREIVALLERDPMLSGHVLRLCRSPIFAGMATISDLKQAVIRIGISTVRDLVVQVALGAKVFESPAFKEWTGDLHKHAVFTAHASRLVARHSGENPGFAYLCGLLHDVGTAAVLVALTPYGSKDVRGADGRIVDSVLHAVHDARAEASKILCADWKLDPKLSETIGAFLTQSPDASSHWAHATLVLAHDLAARVGAPSGHAPDWSPEDLEASGLVQCAEDRAAALTQSLSILEIPMDEWAEMGAQFERVAADIEV